MEIVEKVDLKDVVLETMQKYEDLSVKVDSILNQFKGLSSSVNQNNWGKLSSINERMDRLVCFIQTKQGEASSLLSRYVCSMDDLLAEVEKQEEYIAILVKQFEEQ